MPNLLLLLAAFFLSGCGEKLHKQQSYVFGTLVEITVYGEDAAKAKRVTDQVLKDFDAMHQTLHAWQPGALERINGILALAQPGKPPTAPLPPELIPILQDASRLSALSEGLFNPAIGNLVRLWGFHSDTFEPRLPDPQEIERLVKAQPGMADLRIDGLMLSGANPAVRLDLGGYAKGYALDLAAATMKRQGVDNALINIGGNILALGQKGGQPWKVGIQHPRRAGALATLELHDGEAIGTSGDYQRFFEVDGQRYCHLIDPRTGWPAKQTQAVTVIARGAHAGTLSDVASKPLFIGGPSEWRRLAGKMGIVEALFIAADGNIETTPEMAKRLIWETGSK
ncbi:MAG: FAD:protein FMN transferase [Pseudomonadota bacterium]|nr:FAD:protein FMN transferase [Pseudomonadota bacterium]